MPLLDSGSPVFDGGVGPCDELVQLTHPMIVHEDPGGPLAAPGAALAGSHGGFGSPFHLMATFSPQGGSRVADVRVRRLTLEARAAVLDEVVVLKGVPLVAARGDTGLDGLGVATTVAGPTVAEARLGVYGSPTYAEVHDTAVGEGVVQDLAGSGDTWALAVLQDAPRVLLLARDGTLGSSWPALPLGFPGTEGAEIRVVPVADGFAWTARDPGSGESFTVSFLRDGALGGLSLGGAASRSGDTTAMEIAPSRSPAHGVVVVGYDGGRLLAVGVDRDGEQWRAESLAVAETAPTAPAVVTGNFGVVVAGMHFAAVDADRGRLELMHLSDDGVPRGPGLSFETRRSADQPAEGVAMATDATNVVVHYTYFDSERRAWQTRAMVFRCTAT